MCEDMKLNPDKLRTCVLLEHFFADTYLLLKVLFKLATALRLMSAVVPQSREKGEMPELGKQVTVESYSLMTIFFPKGIKLSYISRMVSV